MGSRRPRRDRDSQTLQAGPPKVPPELLHGVFANAIQSFGAGNEVILDFSLIVPTQFRVDEQGNMADVKLSHTVVARVVVPGPVLAEWMGKVGPRFLESMAASGEADTTEDSGR